MVTPAERMSRRARSARFSRRPPSFAVTLIALAIVFALAWMFFLRSGTAATAPVVSGVQGAYTWSPSSGVAQLGAFSAVAGGAAGGRAELPEDVTAFSYRPPQSAYDATARTETTLGGGGRYDLLTRTIGQWPPVWQVATHSPLDYQGLAAVVRTAVEDGDEAVGIKPLKEGDRAVWRATMTLDGKQVDVVVDQQSGLVTWCSDGEGTFTAEVDWDSPPPAGTTYAVDVPANAAVKTIGDAEAYEESPAAAGRTAGYAPLVSGLAPDGYVLSDVATTPAELRPVSWIGDEVWNLPVGLRGAAVLQLYTRGLSQFTVEQVGPPTLRSLAGVPGWQSEAATGKLSYQETTLQYGAFAGVTARTWYQESGPSLLVAGKRRAVFVTGALTRQELVAFAEGLKPAAAAE
jgi:hypothetical protein